MPWQRPLGLAKTGWILLIFVVPFLGALINVIARPKVTAQDKELSWNDHRRRGGGPGASRRIRPSPSRPDRGPVSREWGSVPGVSRSPLAT